MSRRYPPRPERYVEVQAALTDEPAPTREIWRRVDCWAPGYIQKILLDLVRSGRAIAEGEGAERKYRRA